MAFREEKDLRGPIEVAPRLPKIHRKVAGEVYVEELLPPSSRPPQGYREDVDVELLHVDRPSGFARFAATQGSDLGGERASGVGAFLAHHQASSGAGSDPTYDSYERRSPSGRRPDGYEGSGNGHLSTTHDTDEDVGSTDLFGAPTQRERHRPREEYRDRVPDREYITEPGGYLDPEDRFDDTRSSPGRSPVRNTRRDGTFARYGLK